MLTITMPPMIPIAQSLIFSFMIFSHFCKLKLEAFGATFVLLDNARELGVELPLGSEASRVADAGIATGHDDPAL